MGELLLDHLSYSSVSTYSDCGEKFRLRKTHDIPRVPRWAAMGGSAVHTGTEVLDKQDFGIGTSYGLGVSGETAAFNDAFDAEITEARASGIPYEEWHAAGRTSKEWPNKQDEKWWRYHGPLFVSGWRGWLRRSGYTIYLPAGGEPAIEVAYRVNIGGFPAVGYIDRVMQAPDGQLMIVDLKSGREPSGIDQLRDYGVALHRSEEWTGPAPQWGAYYMAREAGMTVPVPLGPSDAIARDHVYAMALNGIRSGIFLPNVGMMCKSCNVRDFCISWTGKVTA
jgi:PD-(D/E)XK nuclease superfamily